MGAVLFVERGGGEEGEMGGVELVKRESRDLLSRPSVKCMYCTSVFF